MKIFTRERIIYAIITGGLMLAGSWVTAQSSTEKNISEFKIDVTEKFGTVKADIQTNKAVSDQQYTEIKRQLESIDGTIKSLNSAVWQVINKK
jgi:hypothetical protein